MNLVFERKVVLESPAGHFLAKFSRSGPAQRLVAFNPIGQR